MKKVALCFSGEMAKMLNRYIFQDSMYNDKSPYIKFSSLEIKEY